MNKNEATPSDIRLKGEALVRRRLSRYGRVEKLGERARKYDFMLYHRDDREIPIQVKTAGPRTPEHHMNATDWLEIDLRHRRQSICGQRSINRKAIWVFVDLGSPGHRPRYAVMTERQVQKAQEHIYRPELKHCDPPGVRPENPYSFHSLMTTPYLERYRDRWNFLGRVRRKRSSM